MAGVMEGCQGDAGGVMEVSPDQDDVEMENHPGE